MGKTEMLSFPDFAGSPLPFRTKPKLLNIHGTVDFCSCSSCLSSCETGLPRAVSTEFGP